MVKGPSPDKVSSRPAIATMLHSIDASARDDNDENGDTNDDDDDDNKDDDNDDD